MFKSTLFTCQLFVHWAIVFRLHVPYPNTFLSRFYHLNNFSLIFLDLKAIINLFEEFKDRVHFLRIFIFVGHHQQRESSPGQKSSDPDGAKSIRSTWPQPARKQLRSGQPVVLYQPRPHGDRIRGAGLLATQPFRRQKENTHVASLPVTDWKTHLPN